MMLRNLALKGKIEVSEPSKTLRALNFSTQISYLYLKNLFLTSLLVLVN
jgi:hypothetical protein